MTSRNNPTEYGEDGSAMNLRAGYETIKRICSSFRIDSLKARLAAVAEGLSGEGVVDVAVLGQFKAGKSSFRNSLFGREVVPAHVLPATSVVTRIGFGQQEHAVVRHLSGKSEEIATARLPEFVTEKENPENRKQVSIVDVELPGLESYRGIRFVDTPGLGSIFSHNTQTSMDWLPRVGGALVAVSVNHPFSQEDMALLSEVFLHTPEVAILLTKADLVTESELHSVSEFTRQQVAHHTGRMLPILPFSILPGFDVFREEVREYLRHRIVAGREERFHGRRIACARGRGSGSASTGPGCRITRMEGEPRPHVPPVPGMAYGESGKRAFGSLRTRGGVSVRVPVECTDEPPPDGSRLPGPGREGDRAGLGAYIRGSEFPCC